MEVYTLSGILIIQGVKALTDPHWVVGSSSSTRWSRDPAVAGISVLIFPEYACTGLSLSILVAVKSLADWICSVSNACMVNDWRRQAEYGLQDHPQCTYYWSVNSMPRSLKPILWLLKKLKFKILKFAHTYVRAKHWSGWGLLKWRLAEKDDSLKASSVFTLCKKTFRKACALTSFTIEFHINQ